MKFSPIVAVFGHRQVGKTTLISKLAKQYRTLDIQSNWQIAQESPELITELSDRQAPVAIDECQMAPALFPALKERVRQNPRPGQFILSGSVRFSSRQAIRESLTGRFVGWELLPMDLSEAHSRPLPDSLSRIFVAKTAEIDLHCSKYATSVAIERHLKFGGLPGIFSVRDSAIREQKIESQIRTLFERDLQLLVKTTLDSRVLMNLLQALALRDGEVVDWTSLSRATRISVPTLKRLLSAFEAMYLIRWVESCGDEKRPIFYFEDLGERRFLSRTLKSDHEEFSAFVRNNTRHQFHYRPDLEAKMYQFRNRGGAFVPVVYRSSRRTLGLIPTLNYNPIGSELHAARSFQKRFPGAKVLFVHPGTDDHMISSTIRVVGIASIC